MSTPTAARPTSGKDSHWYSIEGEPRYEVIGKSTGRPRPVTIKDARENGWVPSVTTILKILHKEALVNWLIEQSVLACLTAPRKENEALDAFIKRVLHEEKQQEQEGKIARDRGTEIHAALECYFLGQPVPEPMKPWIMPAAEKLMTYGKLVSAEKILVGDGYAGKTDLILDAPDCWWLWDYKSTKNLPDPAKGGAWSEHRLQLSGYAAAYEALVLSASPKSKPIRTANLYVSTLNEGDFVVCEHKEWQDTYNLGFSPLVTHWQWATGYRPEMPADKKREQPVKAAPPAPVKTAEKELEEAAGETATLKGHKVAWSQGVRT